MKQKLLKTIVLGLLVMVGVSAWAQSTYTWSALNWGNDSRGEVTVDGTSLKVTKVKNHLIGIKSTTSFKLPYKTTYAIVKGSHFVADELNQNDPNITINQSGTKGRTKKTTTASTLVFDITEQLPTTTDFFGNVTISQVNLIIKTDAGTNDSGNDTENVSSNNPTITEIIFYQPDFVDLAGSVTFSKASTYSDNEVTDNTDGYSKTLSFKQTSSDGDFGIKFESIGAKLNNSDTYFVIESNINDREKLKVRNLTINGKAWGNTSVASSKVFTVNTDHYVVISSPLGTNSETAENMWGYYQDNTIVPISYCQLYVKNEKNKEVKIYKAGMYNLAEILSMYPSLKTSNDWQFVSAVRPRVETSGTNGNVVKFKGGENNVSCTIKQFKSLIRTLGNMPSEYTNLNLHANTTLTEDEGNAPLKEDILSEFTNNPTFMFHPTFYKYFPTASQKVKISNGNYKYYQYKDGVDPDNVAMLSDGGASADIASYTRKFKEGYNSCVIPFNVTTANLPTGLSAYIFGSCTDAGVVTFTPAGETITAGTPVVIKATTDGYYLIPSASTVNRITTPNDYYATAASNNVCLVGSFVSEKPMESGKTYASGYNCYGISTDGKKFIKMTTTTNTTFYRAFLASSNTSFSRALSLSFDNGDGTTEIVSLKDVNGMEAVGDGAIYNLQGVRMNGDNLPRGIYVKNGKKFVVK